MAIKVGGLLIEFSCMNAPQSPNAGGYQPYKLLHNTTHNEKIAFILTFCTDKRFWTNDRYGNSVFNKI
ncbi:MAG: hypothetical protein IPL67_19520 [Ignavibacteria bacterium]|nr:hypothetical protein [Ignavibacteria bacterium]